MAQTSEKAFETYVEEILLTRGGWKTCSNAEWDKERALFPAQVFAFIADTQPAQALARGFAFLRAKPSTAEQAILRQACQ